MSKNKKKNKQQKNFKKKLIGNKIMQNKIVRKILSILLCIISLFAIYAIWELIETYDHRAISDNQLDEINIGRSTKLMIVAHPSDEVIWGGGHLSEGGYYVVCLTNGRNDTLSDEFENAMLASCNQYNILSYPDKTFFQHNDWSRCVDNITADLKKIMEYCDWELIATHNADGEYGHEHHKMVNNIVTQIYNDIDIDSELYFFGQYYDKSELDSLEQKPKSLSDESLRFKTDKLLPAYESQKKIINDFNHMIPYENWVLYKAKEDDRVE